MDFRIRPIQIEDVQRYNDMLIALDTQTPFMLYEAGERQVSDEGMKQRIESLTEDLGVHYIVENTATGEIGGFIVAVRGTQRRVRHSAYIVTGLLAEYRSKGIGTSFFDRVEVWAKSHSVCKLELTVMAHNTLALKLYEKKGFEKEGVKKKSIYSNDMYYDEYYMGKLL